MINNSEIWDLFLTLLHYYHDFYHCTCESAHPSLWCCSLFSRYFSNTLQALDISVKWEPAAITIQNKLFNFFFKYTCNTSYCQKIDVLQVKIEESTWKTQFMWYSTVSLRKQYNMMSLSTICLRIQYIMMSLSTIPVNALELRWWEANATKDE